MFAFDYAGVSPDIMCLSKGLTGGYMPMAITVTTQKIYDAFYADYCEGKAFMHSHTYSGNPLGCAAANAVLEIMREEDILVKAAVKAAYLRQKLNAAFKSNPYVGEIRSIGLINAIEIVKDRKNKTSFDSRLRIGYQIYMRALDAGLVLRPIGDVLYFNPPLIINEAEIDAAVDLCVTAFNSILKR